MVFNTGAALLDAIVLAVVSKKKEPTDIRSRRMCGKRLRFQNLHCIRFCGDCKRMDT